MKHRISFLILLLMALLLISLLTAFTTPQPRQSLTATPNYDLSATALIARATQTAAAGGDITQMESIGTSTPLAGMCNSLLYRKLTDIEQRLQTTLGRIPGLSPNTTIEALLLEETLDCVTFTTRELTITITVPLPTITAIHDETQLGDTLGRILIILFAQSPLDSLSNPKMVLIFTYGNQTRSFVAQWRDARTIGAGGVLGEEALTQMTLFSVSGN